MARPKEFDVDAALQSALAVFWEKGYEATSVQDLVEAMGIQRASLYATYGDKHALYLAALERYQRETFDELAGHFAGAVSPVQAVRGFVQEVADWASGKHGRRGCLCVNANVELAPHDQLVTETLRQHHQRMESLLAATLQRAVATGELPAKTDCASLATFLLGTVVAINVLGKQRATKKQLQAMVDHALAALAR